MLLVLLPVALVVILILFLSGNGNSVVRSEPLPALQSKGLAFAASQAKDAGFDHVDTHDALGRDRGQGNDQDWLVCFQAPTAGRYRVDTHVKLAVVQLGEACPTADQGAPPDIKADEQMPNLFNRTAWWSRQSLGPDASITFIDANDAEHTVNSGLGNWRVCAQSPAPGSTFTGAPVMAVVTDFDTSCGTQKKAAASPRERLAEALRKLAAETG